MIAAAGYDTVIVAIGARPIAPPIVGACDESGNRAECVWDPISVYGRQDELGKRVVVVGGSEIGTETGLYVAENGHEVTVLTRQRQLAPESDRVHYYSAFQFAWEQEPNFSFITRATTTAIEPGKVTYKNHKGETHAIECDSIVTCGGMQPLQDEAMAFSGCADEVFIIGDCEKIGNIQKSIRASFATASKL